MLLALFSFSKTEAAEFPRSLSATDFKEAVEIFSLPSKHVAWTAHGTRNAGLGLDLGIQSTFVLGRSFDARGDGLGVHPALVPVPSLWMAWDFSGDFQLSANLNPGTFYDGIGSLGAGFQWNYIRDKESEIVISLLGSYTYVDVFGDLFSHVGSAMAQISKDMILWQPYLGLGFSLAQSHINPTVLASGVGSNRWNAAFEAYLGVRLDFLAKVAFQLSFSNFRPSFSVLLSQVF